MKICPVISNTVNYSIRSKNTIPLHYTRYNKGFDSVSFGARIPDGINAELKYKPLTEIVDRWDGTGLSSSDSERVLDLLYDLRYDENVSNDFKSKLLLDDNNEAFAARIHSAKDDENDFNFKVAKAMIEASPDIETTRKQLLTECSQSLYYNEIPLESACPKAAKMLLEASPDEETLRRQLYHRSYSTMNYRTIPFAKANSEKKKAMLQALDYDMQREMLLNPEVVFSGRVQTLQSMAPDDKTRLDILQVKERNGNCLLHECTKDDAELILNQINEQPEKVKAMLLTKNNKGYIPIAVSSCYKADVLLNASPDDETLAKQLTAQDESGMTIVGRAVNKVKDPSKVSEIRMHYLMLSPDDETLMTQLFSPGSSYYESPIADDLYEEDFIKVLNKFRSPEEKKAFLNKKWTRKTSDNALYCINRKKETVNMCDHIRKRIGSSINREKLGDILLDVVRDDSTTNEEALQLIQDYKDCLTPNTRAYFDKIQSSLKAAK